MDYAIRKYPRTPHLEGSRLQPGDEDLRQVPFSEIAGRHLVAEEKIDGANSAVSFDDDGKMLLQSRGHYLTGGYRERHFELMKRWASVHQQAFYDLLGSRYIMYGEWMYAKHTVYYDRLPHYFMEFDIFDRKEQIFLDTASRHAMLKGSPVVSVPVLAEKTFSGKDELLSLLGHSLYISDDHLTHLRKTCERLGVDAERSCRETDPEPLMEGLYLKIEENGQVIDRLKYVRRSFYQAVERSESHWLNRAIIPNGLRVSMDALFEPVYPAEDPNG